MKHYWTDQEDAFLIANYPTMSMEELTRALGRTKFAVNSRRWFLGIPPKHRSARRWTDEELEFVKANYGKYQYKELAEMLGRTTGSIRDLRYDLSLERKRDYWTEEEVAVLREHYTAERVGLPGLKTQLARDGSNIARKARQVGLPPRKGNPTPEGRRLISIRAKQRIRDKGHPRGMLGRKHTLETRRLISEHSRAMWNDPNCRLNSPEYRQELSDRGSKNWRKRKMGNNYSRCKYGHRDDLDGQFFRSAWEANYARYLNWLIEHGEIAAWEYEAETFWFETVRRGCRSYTPDFKVTNKDGSIEWHEVKGWMDPKSRTKIKRFGIFYPREKLIVIDADCYVAIDRQCKYLVPGWE